MSDVKVLMDYLNSKYDSKDPWSKIVSISNIQLCLNLYSRHKSVKLDQKIETVHLALWLIDEAYIMNSNFNQMKVL